MSGREWLDGVKKDHFQCDACKKPRVPHCWCTHLRHAVPCHASRLIAALEEAIALEHKHCGLEFCEAEDEILSHLASQDLSKPKAVSSEPSPKEARRICRHCKRDAAEFGPIGMWQHCPEHEGGSLQHEWELAEPTPDGVAEAKEKA